MPSFAGPGGRMKFETDFNHLYPDFFRNLAVAHPRLTPKDLTLCALLVMRYDTNAIAEILDLDPHSVDAQRSKLRKGFALAAEQSLTTYLLRFTGEPSRS